MKLLLFIFAFFALSLDAVHCFRGSKKTEQSLPIAKNLWSEHSQKLRQVDSKVIECLMQLCNPETWTSPRWIITADGARQDTATLIEHVVAQIKNGEVCVGHVDFAKNKETKPDAKLLLDESARVWLSDDGFQRCLRSFFQSQVCRLLHWLANYKADIAARESNGQYFITIKPRSEVRLFSSEYRLCYNWKTLNVANLRGFTISVVPVEESGIMALKFVTVMPIFKYD